MKNLFFLKIEPDYDNSYLDSLLHTVTAEKIERLIRYRNLSDRKNGIYGDILVRILLSQHCGIPFEEVVVKTGTNGKPFMLNLPSFEFNISHTAGALVVALAEDPIGIDVEKVRAVDISIAKRFFSQQELTFVMQADGDQNRRFFDIWTKKEALIKCSGQGLSVDLRLADVTASSALGSLSTLTIDDYIISICSADRFDESDLTIITEPELIRLWREAAYQACNMKTENDHR